MTPLSSLRLKGYTVWLAGADSLTVSPPPAETLLAKIRTHKSAILDELRAESTETAKRIDRLQHRLMCGDIKPDGAEELMTYLARQTTAATAPPESEACATCGDTLLWRYRGEDEYLPLMCYSCHPPLSEDSSWNIECFAVFAPEQEQEQAA